jgi:hypothetical protein
MIALLYCLEISSNIATAQLLQAIEMMTTHQRVRFPDRGVLPF